MEEEENIFFFFWKQEKVKWNGIQSGERARSTVSGRRSADRS
jgi:hypothetical protein